MCLSDIDIIYIIIISLELRRMSSLRKNQCICTRLDLIPEAGFPSMDDALTGIGYNLDNSGECLKLKIQLSNIFYRI